ncbi:MAG TPA: TetR/AcrR family transcriptional regulator [Ktedonobacteraceae bacterium]|jgi:AcrR family transcriptional regulator
MREEPDSKRTRKGEQAHQRILESALRLFATRGYEKTTMREIAAEAGYSPGLAYRYVASKEELVLALYQNLCVELEEYTQHLEARSLAERFHLCVSRQLELMTPYRDALSALFGTALNPRSKAAVFGEHTAHIRRRARKTYLRVIASSRDAPKETQREDLATVLYGIHLALVLFWLIDESAMVWRTHLFTTFLRDLLKLLLPLLWLPPVAHLLTRLASILGPMLGDERETTMAVLPPPPGE